MGLTPPVGAPYARQFARRGLVALAPDNAGMGELDAPEELKVQGVSGCFLTWARLNHMGLDLTGLRVFDLMAGVGEAYTKLRFTFRYLLGNLGGFDPAAHSVAEADLLELDRWAVAKVRQLARDVQSCQQRDLERIDRTRALADERHRLVHLAGDLLQPGFVGVALDAVVLAGEPYGHRALGRLRALRGGCVLRRCQPFSPPDASSRAAARWPSAR